MEDEVHAAASLGASLAVADVAFVKAEPGGLLGRDRAQYLGDVSPASGGEVVEPDHALIEREQAREKV